MVEQNDTNDTNDTITAAIYQEYQVERRLQEKQLGQLQERQKAMLLEIGVHGSRAHQLEGQIADLEHQRQSNQKALADKYQRLTVIEADLVAVQQKLQQAPPVMPPAPSPAPSPAPESAEAQE